VPLHPSAEAMLPLFTEAGLVLDGETTPEQVRAKMLAAIAQMPRHPLHAVEDRAVRGPAGQIPIRVYRPSASESLPVLVWFHGGGWVLGGLETHDGHCRQLSEALDAVVVSVDYRLAPEAPFPAAVEDCVAAWEWVTTHAADVHGDRRRIAVAGDSAGGNLAAVTCLVARDAGLLPPRFQLLVYPVTDHEFERPSMVENAVGYGLETEHMRWFYGHYTPDARTAADWRVSPLRADVHELPPALVITAEYDPLRDQGEAYARKLEAAGIPVKAYRAAGLFHGFFGMHALMAPAQEPWDLAIEMLRDALDDDRED
jgi:acetyl esterase